VSRKISLGRQKRYAAARTARMQTETVFTLAFLLFLACCDIIIL
jgi:hypothetical protein